MKIDVYVRRYALFVVLARNDDDDERKTCVFGCSQQKTREGGRGLENFFIIYFYVMKCHIILPNYS